MTAGLHCALCTKQARGTPWHPEIIAVSTGRRQKLCFAPIPMCHAGQDPSPVPGGPVRTRATRSQAAASHPDSSRGVSAAHLLLQHSTTYPGEPGVTPEEGTSGSYLPSEPAWGGHSITPGTARLAPAPPQKKIPRKQSAA